MHWIFSLSESIFWLSRIAWYEHSPGSVPHFASQIPTSTPRPGTASTGHSVARSSTSPKLKGAGMPGMKS
eukprot:2402268-Rhodomonas_salina.2